MKTALDLLRFLVLLVLISVSSTFAVLDQGGQVHEDLPASRTVPGYDFYPPVDSEPSPGGNKAHGMACAGIVAASQNNTF